MVKRLAYLMLLVVLTVLVVNPAAVMSSERVVKDMLGREVHLPERVERVVTTYKTATEFVLALGAADRLVGLPLFGNDGVIFKNLRQSDEPLPEVGSKRKGLNLEQIIALQPDLVVLFPYKDGPEVARRLEQQGIASIIINPESFAEIREANLLLGRALGLEEKARVINEQFDKILGLVSRTSDIPAEERKKVYFANRQFLNTVGGGMLQTSVIELAGGINPAAQAKEGFIETSPEQIINWNPDLIIVSYYFQGNLEELKRDPRYQTVAAVKNGAIYRCPSNLQPWDFPGPSSFLLVPWLAKRLYPERFTDVNVRQVVEDFYSALYGISYTELGGQF